MIGWIVTSESISGMRRVWIMLRFTMIHACCQTFVGWIGGRSTSWDVSDVVLIGYLRSGCCRCLRRHRRLWWSRRGGR